MLCSYLHGHLSSPRRHDANDQQACLQRLSIEVIYRLPTMIHECKFATETTSSENIPRMEPLVSQAVYTEVEVALSSIVRSSLFRTTGSAPADHQRQTCSIISSGTLQNRTILRIECRFKNRAKVRRARLVSAAQLFYPSSGK